MNNANSYSTGRNGKNQIQSQSNTRRVPSNDRAVNRQVRKTPEGRTLTRRPRIVTVKQKAKTPFPVGIVFSCVVLTALILMVMVYFAEIDKLSNQMTKLNKDIITLENTKDKLSERLDSRDDIHEIEKRAKEMGMINSELLEHKYVNLTNDDKTEIVKYENEKGSGFGFMLSGIRELFDEFFK